jgi:hypothetical protein
MPVGTIIKDAETAKCCRTAGAWRMGTSGQGWGWRLRQPALQEQHQPQLRARRHPVGLARQEAEARTSCAGRRRPAGHAQRRQVDIHRRNLATHGPRLPTTLHDAAPQPGRGARGARRRASSWPTFPGSSKVLPRAPASGTSSCATCSAPGCCCTSSTAPFDESVDPVAQARAIVAELKKYDPGTARQAALAGLEQAGHGAREES